MEEQIYHLRYALDTFYFLVCGALVMWMAAGFSMLEAGLVRVKNTNEILTKNIALYSISCIMYMICGYSIMYGGSEFSLFLSNISDSDLVQNSINDLSKEGIEGSAVYSKASDFFFQVVFVATCMSIVSGAVAERMKLWSFLIFSIVMTGFIYPVEGSWTWGGKSVLGLFSLSDLGFSDFAGSGIVHLAGASAALSAVIFLGSRIGKYGKNGEIYVIPGANLPLSVLGVFILWLGWFGFNGGSVLKLSDINNSNSVAVVFINTNLAACAGALSSLLLSYLMFKKADLTMIVNGVLAGLVVITAEPLTPSPVQASIFGFLGGLLVVISIITIDKLKLDDPVGAISVHGVCGILGLLLVPITNSNSSFIGQIVGTLTIFIWVFLISSLFWIILKHTIGIRVGKQEEYQGMDIIDCGMEAYPEFSKNK